MHMFVYVPNVRHSIGILIALIAIFHPIPAHAIPPFSPYAPGDTIAPTCAPGSTNCTVQMMHMNADESQVIFNDNGILTGSSTFWFNKTTGALTSTGGILHMHQRQIFR